MPEYKKYITNDGATGSSPQGCEFVEETFTFSPLASDSTAHATSSQTLLPARIMRSAGNIVDFFLGVTNPALSASGFVSGDVSAGLRINSASVLSTAPSIAQVATSAGVIRKATNVGGGVSAVINTASATFSAGDMLQYDWATVSGASAAAGAAAKGLYVGIVVRYFPR